MRLTIDREGDKFVMIDEATGEIAILDNQEQAVSNFASWIYAGHLSGKPTATRRVKMSEHKPTFRIDKKARGGEKRMLETFAEQLKELGWQEVKEI